jgi:probable F420-dependent oxidoreductase
MEFGCHLPIFGPDATRAGLLTFAREMERLGYESLWASDHIVIPHTIRSRYPYSDTGQFPLAPDATFLEPLTALAMVAGVTERAKLGTTVLVLPHRHPVLAAKALATLDHLSGGRVILGAGVGWMREEIELLGAPFAERGAWSDEAIRIMRACWRDERTSFHGRFFNFDDIGCFPKPVRGDIPIWMGGHAKPALRRIVELLKKKKYSGPASIEMFHPMYQNMDPAEFAKRARAMPGWPQRTHAPPAVSSSGRFRTVACVSALICASHSAVPHQGAITKPGRPSMICLNSS